MNRFLLALLVLLPMASLNGAPTAGEIYTWTDTDGNLHITDRPPTKPSQVQDVLRYAPPSPSPPQPNLASSPVDSSQTDALHKHLARLKERKTLLDKTIAENQISIADAEKDLAHYRKRSGSYARRNEKAIQRQLTALNNNLASHQSDLRYVVEDIDETERQLDKMKWEREAERNK